MNNLDLLLLALVGSQELVDCWWNSPNTQFLGDTPNQWFYGSQEERDKVIEYIKTMHR